MIVEEDFKRWTAKRKAALVTEILQGKTSVSEASRAHDSPPSEIEEWVDVGTIMTTQLLKVSSNF